MKLTGSVSSYEDFKYVMQDTGNLYLGAKYSYEELLSQEMIPFKLKAVINHYILKEASSETTLESQFYYLEGDSFLYETFAQLKTKVKVQIQTTWKPLFGREKLVYKEQILKLHELVEMNLAKKKASGVIIREIIISKLGLMTFSI
ncbi:MAG: hypothetical protein NC429_03515 [Lachnospiraceae bacterium]|nr:hypothetical protein [Lachnospiraceae bacterium]